MIRKTFGNILWSDRFEELSALRDAVNHAYICRKWEDKREG
jgi:hypothetical protein